MNAMKYLPDIILLVVGLLVMVLLLYLGALSENWVAPACFLGVAVVYFGWHRTLVNLMWRMAGKDPDDFDFHLPG
jgi:glycerol uptake facilitator-like aquaporin